MTNNINPQDLQGFGFYGGRLAESQGLTSQDQAMIKTIIGRLELVSQAPGLPWPPSGDKRGDNGLLRTNWFNGRYLTAEALSRQDVYFDHRSRLNAQALMPGIAWGLGIQGVDLNKELTLQQGLAFDGVGRPILVSEPFKFNLKELMGEAQKTPRMVVGGAREFLPCVCLAPDPDGESGGSAAVPPGNYLLVIEASERPTGKAKVTGDLCGGKASARCENEAWKGGFGLSLVRFPVDVPSDNWALRGTLSAYYFDVFEHRLWKRWDPTFPVAGHFAANRDPKRYQGMAIPLAMLHLQDASSVLFLDQWIPRRMICATPGEDWHRASFGAPPRAAAWARIHQFQTMLQESLVQYPMSYDPQPGAPRDLYSRGFRHIPPIGFLPITPKKEQMPQFCTDFRREKGKTISVPYQGLFALFDLQTDNGDSTIAPAGKSTGLPLGEGTCTITLQMPASQVSLELYVKQSSSAGSLQNMEEEGSTSEHSKVEFLDSLSRVMDTKYLKDGTGAQALTLGGDGGTAVRIDPGSSTLLLCKFCFTPVASIGETAARLDMVKEASRQATAYFAGTNVVPYSVVALHDDDILEDLHNVIDKDPIQLEKRGDPDQWVLNWPFPNASITDQMAALSSLFITNRESHTALGILAALGYLGYLLRLRGLYIEPLVNRHTEVVKLVVPLQGLSRLHPVIGATPKDAASQAQEWGLVDTGNRNAATLAGLLEEGGVDVLPRSFVVYVKQRIVLLDLVFMALEILQLLVDLVLTTLQAARGVISTTTPDLPFTARLLATATTANFRSAFRARSESDQLLIRATLAQPVVNELLVRSMAATMPELAKPGRAKLFVEHAIAVEQDLPPSVRDPQERQVIAQGQVADAWAADFPAAQVLQLLVAVQPPQQTVELLRRLEAKPGPARATVDDSLNLDPPTPFTRSISRELYAETRQRMRDRPLVELVQDLPNLGAVSTLTVGDLLARSPQEAATILGGPGNLDTFKQRYLNDRAEALNAAIAMPDGAPPELIVAIETEIAAGKGPAQVFQSLRQTEEVKPQRDEARLRQISSAETLLRVSGNRIETLAPLLRRQQR